MIIAAIFHHVILYLLPLIVSLGFIGLTYLKTRKFGLVAMVMSLLAFIPLVNYLVLMISGITFKITWSKKIC